ncbi:putative DNA primase/helicase [Oxalobacteraceae bacterium GrIS 1.11]
MNGHNNAPVTMDAARAALSFVSSNDRDMWWRIGMALKSEFGDGGWELFETWSESASNFDVGAAKTVWKGIRPGGAVTIATLIGEAKAGGFNPKDYAPAVPLSATERARIKRERAERDSAAELERASKQAAAAEVAAQEWAAAAESGVSAYLERKAVAGYGVRFAARGVLLVPLCDGAGKLWSVQRIFANGDKRILKDGRVSGCFHIVGDVGASAWTLIAEGYATAATLHKVTGYAVAVAFNEGNVRHVAAAMRHLHPAAQLLICADDDSETEASTGKNPGIVAAIDAAKLVRGAWCKPEGLATGQTDFNDLAASAGLEVVRAQIAAAIALAGGASPVPPIEAAPAVKADAGKDAGKPLESSATALKQAGQGVDKGRRKTGATASVGDASGGNGRPFFTVNDGGVWFHGFSQQGDPLPAQWICSPLHITAQSRDAANGEWGYLLEFADADGNPKRWAMPASMLAGDGTQYRSTLLGMGLQIGAGVTAKNQLSVYIQTEKTDQRVRCTDRIGWHDDQYVLPDRTIGEGNEKVMFQAAGGVVSQFKQRGTLEQWKSEIAAPCRGNSRMLFCVSAAFAATVLHLARVPSGGFHIWGDSSSGKSTAFKVAGSVFGGKDYPRNWRMTDNALETVAAQHSDALLLLDEIAQVDPKVVGDTVYMLANETGKGRATQTATARKVATWRLLFLSDGEISLANHMEQVGKGTKAGHDVRMAHIPADAGKGFGVYDTLHDFPSGAAMSDHLVNMSHQHYGTAGMAFIEYAVGYVEKLSDGLSTRIGKMAAEMCPANSHGQVSRVATRFALVGEAGEIATRAGITGWEPGEATSAARTCFAAWLEGRGGAGNVEHVSILRQVSAFFQLHGEARFVSWHRATDDHKPNTINRAGFRRMLTSEGIAINTNSDHHKAYGDITHPKDAEATEQEYFVLPEVFKNEICKGFNPKSVTRLLIERGLLVTDKDSATRKERLPGLGLVRCYRFKPEIVGIDA